MAIVTRVSLLLDLFHLLVVKVPLDELPLALMLGHIEALRCLRVLVTVQLEGLVHLIGDRLCGCRL